MLRKFTKAIVPALAGLLGVALAGSATAQLDLNFERPLGANRAGRVVSATAQFTAPAGERPAILYITARIADGWHIYSLAQQTPPIKTTIRLGDSPHYELAGRFRPAQPPKVHIDQKIWPGLRLEEHFDTVTFFAPLELEEGIDPAMIEIRGVLDVQACSNRDFTCTQEKPAFTARLGERVAIPNEALAGLSGAAFQGEYRAEQSAVVIAGHMQPATVRPGSVAKLVFTATPDAGWHIYARANREDPDSFGGKPTLVVVEDASGLTHYQAFPSEAPVEKTNESGPEQYHEGPVTWTVPIEIPQEAQSGPLPVRGYVGYHVCRDGGCQTPLGVQFDATITVGETASSDTAPVTFRPATYAAASELAATLPAPPIWTRGTIDLAGLVWIIPAALLGGLILNLMPCVLPVIGLKVMSFVQQGGEDRGRVFALNVWYVLGLLSVFMMLASAAAFLNLGWGEQFTVTWFKVTMIGLVFVMALSFLGVWEIPIPGFVGHGKMSEMAQREGIAGAFSKGVVTTLLATPCSGPFLGPVFGYTLEQPPVITYLIFLSVGLGMAAPYLVLGAKPELVRFLPKPGAWMDTFKHLMGFVLLGTVVYLFSTIHGDFFIPTLTLMVALWFACWWIGRTPITAAFKEKATAWLGGAAVAASIGYGAFALLGPSRYELPWEPFSQAALEKAQREGKTVLVDFTANWCPTCHLNSKRAINTAQVNALVEKNEVVPLLADWTDRSEAIKQKLAEYGQRSIPLLVVIPANKPDEPLILPDLIGEGDVIEALQKAGPSRSLSADSQQDPLGPTASTAMRPSQHPAMP